MTASIRVVEKSRGFCTRLAHGYFVLQSSFRPAVLSALRDRVPSALRRRTPSSRIRLHIVQSRRRSISRNPSRSGSNKCHRKRNHCFIGESPTLNFSKTKESTDDRAGKSAEKEELKMSQ
jgi:hypothetical protein